MGVRREIAVRKGTDRTGNGPHGSSGSRRASFVGGLPLPAGRRLQMLRLVDLLHLQPYQYAGFERRRHRIPHRPHQKIKSSHSYRASGIPFRGDPGFFVSASFRVRNRFPEKGPDGPADGQHPPRKTGRASQNTAPPFGVVFRRKLPIIGDCRFFGLPLPLCSELCGARRNIY